MKRSCMLLKLHEILSEQPDDITLENAAEDILSRLEQAGMRPPAANILLYEKNAEETCYIRRYEWEKEDE